LSSIINRERIPPVPFYLGDLSPKALEGLVGKNADVEIPTCSRHTGQIMYNGTYGLFLRPPVGKIFYVLSDDCRVISYL
jgi:hypothetical protein